MMGIDDDPVLRVVVAKRGRFRAGEFRLRKGEVGLLLFLKREIPGPDAILEAVRAAGKQGELAIAELPMSVLRNLDLRIVLTPGGTPSSEVNAIHIEARLRRLLRVWLWLRRIEVATYFNERFAAQLAESATVRE